MHFRRGLLLWCLTVHAPRAEGASLRHEQASSHRPVHTEIELEEDASIKSLRARHGKIGEDRHGKDKVFDTPKREGVPVINFDMNILHHFEVLVSMIHLFKGNELPYHSSYSPHIEKLLGAARQNGSEVYVNKRFVHTAGRREILSERLQGYDVKLGYHTEPDLTVLVTVYSNLETFKMAFENGWRNDKRILLVVHRNKLYTQGPDLLDFKREMQQKAPKTKFKDFIDFNTWENAIGLMPKFKRYVMPTFFPYRHTDQCGASRVHDASWTPTFCVHGTYPRRDWGALGRAMDAMPRGCNYSVALAGIGRFPEPLDEYSPNVKNFHLSDINYMDFFCSCDYILPLLSANTSTDYFESKLSSTAARAIGHDLPIIAWSKFREAYPMCPGLYYNDDEEFLHLFKAAAGCL